MYLHTILSGLLHIMKTTPHIMRNFKKSPYKTVAAFHTLAIMYNILIKKLHCFILILPFKRNTLTHMYRLIDETSVLNMEK